LGSKLLRELSFISTSAYRFNQGHIPFYPQRWHPKRRSPSTTSQVSKIHVSCHTGQQDAANTLPADLKNTSDDAIPNYLNSLKFEQSHYLTDVRLALGYSAFLVAGACFLWDYKFGFDATKYYTAAAVAVYMVLNGALTMWIWGREKSIVYVGTAPSGETVRPGNPAVAMASLYKEAAEQGGLVVEVSVHSLTKYGTDHNIHHDQEERPNLQPQHLHKDKRRPQAEDH